MPEPSIACAVVLLVALVESTPAVRIPLGLVLAIALLAADSELLPIALLGAIGVMIARLALALVARSGRDRLGAASPAMTAQREALRAHLSRSPTYARTTFTLAALPGIPAAFVFPLLGAMRAPLAPALAGTIAGRLPILALTTALFTWLGRVSTEDDEQAALLLGVMAILLLVLRTLNRVDWQHRAESGTWRMREDDSLLRMVTFGEAASSGSRRHAGALDADAEAEAERDDEVIEGELVGEDYDDGDGDEGEESPGPRSS